MSVKTQSTGSIGNSIQRKQLEQEKENGKKLKLLLNSIQCLKGKVQNVPSAPGFSPSSPCHMKLA